MTATLAVITRIWRFFSPTTRLIIAILAAFLIFGAYCSHRAAESERDRQASAEAKIERKAAGARETAASERATETDTINNREKDLSNAVQSLPDAAPSRRRLALACDRLRQQGSDLPADCRPAG